MKIVVVTSVAASAEPRAPRHALAAKRAFPKANVVFVDAQAADENRPDPARLANSGVARETFRFPSHRSNLIRLAVRKARVTSARMRFRATGTVSPDVFGDRMIGLEAMLKALRADVYIAHNIETLVSSFRAARANKGILAFDCMEYYSDMGDSQSSMEAAATKAAETRLLPFCALILASSDALAEVLREENGVQRPLSSPNVPPLTEVEHTGRGPGLRLYWRNSVIGFGQRGLDDVLVALTLLPKDVQLFLQGRPAGDGGAAIDQRTHELGVRDRVTVLPPYLPEAAVSEAARYDVGLCLERRGPRNHDLTISNKLFDYHMAGLAVIATDLMGLRSVIERSKGGLLVEPGSPGALATAVRELYNDPAQCEQLRRNARAFAISEGNLEKEMIKIVAAMQAAFSDESMRLN